MTVNGPIRIVPVANIPGLYLAVDRLGQFLAQGRQVALEPMAESFNREYFPENPAELRLPWAVEVTACPKCGYPKESEEQEKCLECLNPPLPTVEEEVKQKETEQSEWF